MNRTVPEAVRAMLSDSKLPKTFWAEAVSVEYHLKVFVELFEELAIIGDAIVEEERVIILVSSLPDRFSSLVTAFEAHEKIPAWEVVTERLLNEGRRQRGGPGTSDSSEKLLVSFKRNKKLIKCFKCGKEGHIKRQCRVYEERLRKENRTFQANKAVDARSSSTGETIMFTSAFPIDIVDCESWIVDSGATQHMCNKKSEFSSYSDLSSPVRVEIGGGRALKGVGVRDVRLKIILPNMQEPSKEIECVPWSFPQEEKHEDSEGELELLHSTKNRAAPDRYGEWVGLAEDKLDILVNVEEALHGPKSKLWKAAMEEEMASINTNNVWSLLQSTEQEINQTQTQVFLEQSAYTKALLSRFGMDNANSVATPVDVNADFVTTSDEVEECDKDLYQNVVDADWAGDRSNSAQIPKYHGRSKHIDIKFHYVRDLVRNKEVDLVYCLSNDMLADIFTKGLSAEKFSRLRRKLGVVFFEKHIQCEKEC
ncbi:Zinc finger CCHC-type [Trinorchestia longiramus]|nr:Zinc finger CCHC-type [Trinorchestia longiramus]